MNELDFIAKYGPTGILALLMVGAGRVGLKLMDRAFTLADKFDRALDNYLEQLRSSEIGAERRHSETRERIETVGKETRHAVRQDVTAAQLAVESRIDRFEDLVMERRRQRRLAAEGPVVDVDLED